MTLQRQQYYNSIQGLVEAREKTLTVLFKSDEQMMKKIYERDLKLKFKKLYKSVNYTQRPIKGFEVVFEGKVKDLVKVTKYIEKLDRKNKIYNSKVFS